MTDLAQVQEARKHALAQVNADIAWHVFVHLMEMPQFDAQTRDKRLDAEVQAWQIVSYIAQHPGWVRTPNLALSSALRIAALAERKQQ